MATKQPGRRPKIRGWQLLLLPIIALVALLCYVIYNGFTYGWPDWTGFGPYIPVQPPMEGYEREKTLWDWLQLLVIPVILAVVGFVFNRTQQTNAEKAARQRDETERKIAEQRAQDAVLETYLDPMAELLVDKGLHELQPGDEVRNIARIRTLTALRRLDGDYNQILIQFLRDADLIGGPSEQGKPIIDMRYADLHGADLCGTKLNRVDLREADLRGAILSGADLPFAGLYRADLQGAELFGSNLFGGNLQEANLQEAKLEGARLGGAELPRANLQRAALPGAILQRANLFGAILQQAILNGASLREVNLQDALLQGANLQKADLQGANLQRTDLQKADLQGANLRGASLRGADLQGANLREADLRNTDLQEAKLQGATMPDGTRHE